MKWILVLFLTHTVLAVVQAKERSKECLPDAAQNVYVADIGVMGLASHDLFAWDRKKMVNRENGRLDLSTIFDSAKKGDLQMREDWWDNPRIPKLGNRKNSENAPVYTVATHLVQEYEALLKKGHAPIEARKILVQKWHQMVQVSFERLTQLSWPEASAGGTVNNQEQAAMRILHDILPGEIILDAGDAFCVTEVKTAKTRLTENELQQAVNPYDGDYDPEYNAIVIPFLLFKIRLDLEQIDARFIRYAGLDPAAAKAELQEVGQGQRNMSDTSFAGHLTSLFAKAQSPINQDGTLNMWLAP